MKNVFKGIWKFFSRGNASFKLGRLPLLNILSIVVLTLLAAGQLSAQDETDSTEFAPLPVKKTETSEQDVPDASKKEVKVDSGAEKEQAATSPANVQPSEVISLDANKNEAQPKTQETTETSSLATESQEKTELTKEALPVAPESAAKLGKSEAAAPPPENAPSLEKVTTKEAAQTAVTTVSPAPVITELDLKQEAAAEKEVATSSDAGSVVSSQTDAKVPKAKALEPAATGAKGIIEKAAQSLPKIDVGDVEAIGDRAMGVGQAAEQDVLIKRFEDKTQAVRTPEVDLQGGMFFKGKPVEAEDRNRRVEYRYLSRGAWLIRKYQPYIDRLAGEMLKSDSTESFADLMEVTRSFSYICMLIASDDGSEEMLRSIARAVASHREMVATLKMTWVRATPKAREVMADYISILKLKDVKLQEMNIPAGSLSNTNYQDLNLGSKRDAFDQPK